MTAPERPLRADAERNRRRILDAAAVVFSERGLDVAMEEIASAAGVGVGTLYRRFENRDVLVDALFEEKIAAIADLAREALEIEDPWQAFETFFRNACRMQAADRGLREVLLTSHRGRERAARARDAIRPLAGQLVLDAQAAGVLRDDLSPLDMPMMQFGIGYVAGRTRPHAEDYFERLVTIVLDGLRAQGGPRSPMPAPPLTIEQLELSLSAQR